LLCGHASSPPRRAVVKNGLPSSLTGHRAQRNPAQAPDRWSSRRLAAMDSRHALTLAGDHVRLEPLTLEHVPVLVAAINEDPASFRFSTAPDTEVAMSAWVQDALAAADVGSALPFATYSCAQKRIVGSTRFYEIERWRSPAEKPQRDRGPDACL